MADSISTKSSFGNRVNAGQGSDDYSGSRIRKKIKPLSSIELSPVVDKGSEDEGWLMVYLDVITLLLIMFVVMLSQTGGPSPIPDRVENVSSVSTKESPEPESKNDFSEGIGDLGGSIDVIERKNGISFRISNDVLFDSGKSELAKKGFVELEKLVTYLKRTDYRVTVAGHTDNVPISTIRFPSNWELSSARAGSVVRFFQSRGIAPSRLVARGHADTEPLADNLTAENRAKNRRVELVLEDMSKESEE